MSLILENIEAGYGDTTVLRGIDLIVPTGSAVALLGPNGAGKTTLLHAAAGLVDATTGHIRLGPEDITRRPPEHRARSGICLIPEGRGIFPGLTVADHLRLYGDEDRWERALDAFPKLKTRYRQTVGTMSGGEQQMVALSRALVSGAHTVLLDEVSMGLAPNIVDEVFEFIEVLRDQNCSLLLVEQYVPKALAFADYVYLLNRGTVSFAGEPSEVDGEALFAEYVGA